MLLAAAVAFVVVFLAGEESGKTGLLYVVPVALLSLELGLAGGLASAALALGALALSPGAISVVAGGVAFLTVGAVAGRFGDRMRDAQRRQQRLLSSGLALAHLEVADELPEMLARSALELTGSQGTRVELLTGESAVAGAPRDGVHIPIEVRDASYGSLWVSRSRPLTPEDRASLEILALQTAVAAESRRLLDAERERALIGAELEAARTRLAERAGQLRELIARQEAERHLVAHELHDEAAQMLAAALLNLGALERELGSGPRLGELRSDIHSTLNSLRALAASLRPPALELGLRTALERLAEDALSRGFSEVTVDLDGIDGLSDEADTMVYRVVQEALEAVGPARSASIQGNARHGQIVIDLHGLHSSIDPARLAVLKARLELAGGTLDDGPAGLRAVIPVLPVRAAA